MLKIIKGHIFVIIVIFFCLNDPNYAHPANTYLDIRTLQVSVYSGVDKDYIYLKEYVLDFIKKNFDINLKSLNRATIENIDFLRNVVHHMNWEYKLRKRAKDDTTGYLFKEQAGGDCGFISTTLFDIYKALGFKVRRYDLVDGALYGHAKYRDSHVLTEVYIPELNKYIVQDGTYNIACTLNGNRLSLSEIKESILLNGLSVDLINKSIHMSINPNGVLSERQKISILDDYYLGSIINFRSYNGNDTTEASMWFSIQKGRSDKQTSLSTLKDLISHYNFYKLINNRSELYQALSNINDSAFVHAFVTKSLDGTEKSILLQFTNTDGRVFCYDPINDLFFSKSYDNLLYWEFNSIGYVDDKYTKYLLPILAFDAAGKSFQYLFPFNERGQTATPK
jgi:hypothetical protein